MRSEGWEVRGGNEPPRSRLTGSGAVRLPGSCLVLPPAVIQLAVSGSSGATTVTVPDIDWPWTVQM